VANVAGVIDTGGTIIQDEESHDYSRDRTLNDQSTHEVMEILLWQYHMSDCSFQMNGN
jgi:hypothetical protein